jgi:hypothetical protein
VSERYLPPEDRAGLVQQIFETIAAIGFVKWQAEELALGNRLGVKDRQSYLRTFTNAYFGEFQRMAEGASDSRLEDMREFWTEQADAMGLLQWQQVLQSEKGASAWYDAIAAQTAADHRFQKKVPDEHRKQSMEPEGEQVDPAWDLDKVRPVTRSLLKAISLDTQPTPAASMDFGIKSQEHYEAIYYPVRNDEITFAGLDAVYGNGPKITELVNAAPSNPHKGIQFETPWDHILPRGGLPDGPEKQERAAGGKLTLADLKKEGEKIQGEPARQKTRGLEPER